MKRRHLPSFRYAIRSRSLRNQKAPTKSTYFKPIWGMTRKGEYHLLGTSSFGISGGPRLAYLQASLASVRGALEARGITDQVTIRYFCISPWTAIDMLQAGELTVAHLVAADGWAKKLCIEGVFGPDGPTLLIDRDEVYGTLIISTKGRWWDSKIHFYPTLEEQFGSIEQSLAGAASKTFDPQLQEA